MSKQKAEMNPVSKSCIRSKISAKWCFARQDRLLLREADDGMFLRYGSQLLEEFLEGEGRVDGIPPLYGFILFLFFSTGKVMDILSRRV